MIVHTILYVSDQNQSRDFYKAVLNQEPDLDVPGMTEFKLSESHVLGLMPEKGIKKLLGDILPDPSLGSGIPRVEMYIRTNDPETMYSRAIKAGAKTMSSIQIRDWGDRVGYVLDHDGHVLAIAS